jgi:vesicle transport through interaction with t-SNAREs protein 1
VLTPQVKELDHRQKILAGSAKLEESNDRLSNAHRIAVETENIGGNVLAEMYGQRKQLEGVRDNVIGSHFASNDL